MDIIKMNELVEKVKKKHDNPHLIRLLEFMAEKLEELTDDSTILKEDDTDDSNMASEKKTEKQCLIDDVFQPNSNGKSEWILIDKLITIGLWSEKSNGNGRNGVYLGEKRYNWEKKPEKGKIKALRTIGFNTDKLKGHSRPIHEDIKKYCKNKTCCFCGSSSNIVPDHKNDLYNDIRVLNLDTQTQDDFQPACNACNLRKNKVMTKTRKENKRQPPPDMIRTPFGIDFTVGDETFNPGDVNGMVGTYWHDPIDFINKALTMKLKDKDEEILSLKNKLKDNKITKSEE